MGVCPRVRTDSGRAFLLLPLGEKSQVPSVVRGAWCRERGVEPYVGVYTGTVSSGDPGTGVNAPASLTVVWTLVYSAPEGLSEPGCGPSAEGALEECV